MRRHFNDGDLPVNLGDAPGGFMIRAMLAFLVIFLVATFPATWLMMLFLGNLGLNLSYWGTLPLGILVSALLGSTSAQMS